MLLPYATAIAFIEEYIKYREKSWASFLNQATTWTSSFTRFFVSLPNPENRKTDCEQFTKLIEATATADEAEAPENLIRIIDIIANKARATQATQLSYKETYILSYFTSDNSLFAKMLHAIRTILVRVLKEHYKEQYNAEIINLKNSLEKMNKIIDNDLKSNIDISTAKNDRNIIYNRLLDLHDEATIKDACKYDKFPPSLPTASQKLHTNIPAVYNEKYYNYYYESEIVVDPERKVCCDKEVKKLTNADDKPKEEKPDILNVKNYITLSSQDNFLTQSKDENGQNGQQENPVVVMPETPIINTFEISGEQNDNVVETQYESDVEEKRYNLWKKK